VRFFALIGKLLGNSTVKYQAYTMSILEERGLFWWHGEPISDKHFAPEASVLGLLRIDDEGVATLELDGDLPSDQGPFGVLSRNPEALKGRLIEGLLSTSGKHVLLIELGRYGGSFSSNNLSHGLSLHSLPHRPFIFS
jgi:hypothetical protein